jgi:hypothetical protein
LNGTKSFPVADKLAALGVPFVFSTGYSAQDMRDGCRDRPLLKKPIRYQELVGIFTSLLAGPTLRVCPKAHCSWSTRPRGYELTVFRLADSSHVRLGSFRDIGGGDVGVRGELGSGL